MLGPVIGAVSMAAVAAVPVGPADGSTRVSNYYSFNVFEQRGGQWVYAAAFLP